MTTKELSNKEIHAGGKSAPLPTQVAEGLIELLPPEELTNERKLDAELDYLKDDRTGSAHLTPLLTDHLVKGDFDPCTGSVVVSHLRDCAWCASMLREALQLCAVPADHPAFTLWEQAEWSPTEDSGTPAGGEAAEDGIEAAEVALAFEGWVEQVADGLATLRLVDGEGRRSTATYAVTDLQRDHIPAEAGTSFRCQVVRESTGFRVSFQPVERRVVSKTRRKQLEDKMMAAYSTLKNDY